MTAENAIARFRRDITLGALLKGALAVGAVLVLLLHFLPLPAAINPSLLLMLLVVVWVVLWYGTMKSSRLAVSSLRTTRRFSLFQGQTLFCGTVGAVQCR